MDSHPARCLADAACLAGIGVTILGWLPAALAAVASLLAALYYGLQVYDRLKKGQFHHG